MYESFYGLTEKPFTLLPDPDYLYLSPKHQRALTLLEYGMMNQAGFSVICGDTGAGKTTLIRRLLAELGDDTTVGLITNTHQSFGDLLNWVLMAFGIESDGKNKSQMHQIFIDFLIDQYANNNHTVLIVDEAQNMNADTLEELRMLSNINADKDQVLQVILAGQPALRDTLRKPELMQFAQRISVDYYLESLSKEETKLYINHRLNVAGAGKQIFTEAACDAIYRYSGGTPRLINLLCDTTLVYGFAEQTKLIDTNLVNDVVREQHSNSIVPTFNKPLTDEDIDQLEKIETIKHQQVAEPASVEESLDDTSEIVIAEMSKRAAQAVSNYDAVGSVNSTEAEAKIVADSRKNKPDTRKTSKTTKKKAEQSKVTPIKQDVEEGATDKGSMSDVLDVIDQQAEKKLSKENTGSSNDTVNELSDDEIRARADGLAVEEAIARAEAEEKQQEQINQKQFNTKEVEQEEIAKEEPEIEEKIVFEEMSHDEHQSRAKDKIEDIYPIIQVENNSSKGLKVLILGFIGGLILASAISIGGAYLLFGDKLNDKSESVNVVQDPITLIDKVEKNAELERVKLEAIQKERDAALAITKALERERDAAIATAKAQESMRAAERRAAEILAEQERKSARDLKIATRRARKAEIEAAQAKEREHNTKLKAIESKRAAEAKLMKEIAKKPVKANIPEPEVVKAVAPAPVAKVVTKKPVKKSTKSSKFSANPCSSPSSKFLSTCKK
jgi:general secretion pathway protein A